MRRVCPIATLLAAALILSAPLAATADGPAWWDPLNLAGTAKPARAPARATARAPAKKDSSWLKLPGFGASGAKSASKPAARKSSEPSTLAKMNNSTKRFFAGAKDALTFGDDKKPAPPRPTGYGPGRSERRIAGQDEKKPSGNILTSWWKKEEPQPKRPRTVPDFISGERPY
jgi:hypothetical protein